MKKIISSNIKKLIFSSLLLVFGCSNNKDSLNKNKEEDKIKIQKNTPDLNTGSSKLIQNRNIEFHNKDFRNKAIEFHKNKTKPINNNNGIESLKQEFIFKKDKKLNKSYKFKFPENTSFKEEYITTLDGESINILFNDNRNKSKNKKVILFFNGNDMNMQSILNEHNSIFKDIEMSFMYIDFRGYGKSSGIPNENGLIYDANAAYDYLLKKGFLSKDIILGGISLGTGIAIDLAANTAKFNSLFLISPYSSIKKYGEELLDKLDKLDKSEKDILKYNLNKLNIFDLSNIEYGKNNVFDSENKIKKIDIPTIILAGENDWLKPKYHSEVLNKNCEASKIFVIPNYGHDDVFKSQEFKNNFRNFLNKY